MSTRRERELLKQNRLLVRQEALAERDVAKVIRNMAEDVASRLAYGDEQASLQIVDDHRPAMAAVLEKRLLQTALLFGGNTLTRISTNLPKSYYGGLAPGTGPVRGDAGDFREIKDAREVFEGTILQWIKVHALQRATSVMGTLKEAVRGVLVESFADGTGEAGTAKAIREAIGRKLSASSAARIARTEMHTASTIGSDTAARSTGLEMIKEWASAEDSRTRPSHNTADGQEVGIDEPFKVGAASLMVPGDPNGPAKEIINCFPGDVLISTAGLKAVIIRHYTGKLIQLEGAGGVNLTVTPNHPVLTQRGWIGAGKVVEGDYLIHSGIADRALAEPNIEDGLASAESLARLAKLAGDINRPEFGAVNLHGEVPNHQVEVVTPPRELRDGWEALGREAFGQVSLMDTDISAGRLLFARMGGERFLTDNRAKPRVMGAAGEVSALLRSEPGHSHSVSIAPAPGLKAKIGEALPNGGSLHLKGFGHRQDGLPACIHGGDAIQEELPALPPALQIGRECRLARVIGIGVAWHDGPVFNFETDTGIIIGNGVVTHNCRCGILHHPVIGGVVIR